MMRQLKSKYKTRSYINLISSNRNSRDFKKNILIPGVLLIIFLVTVYRKIQLQVPSLTDFSGAYYPAGKLVTENPEQLYKLSNIDIFGFVNIPIVAYLFVPFSWLDPTTAKVAFTFLGIVAFITALGVMIKHFEIRGWSRVVLLVLVLINTPLYNSIWFGNTTHITLLLMASSIVAFNKRRYMLSGCLLGFAGLIKLFLLVPSLHFAIKNQWRSLSGFVVVVLGTIGASMMVFGVQLHLDWLQRCVFPLSNKAIAAYNLQSLDAFLIRSLTNAPLNSWEAIDVPILFRVLRYSLVLILVSTILITSWKVNQTARARQLSVTNLGFYSVLVLGLLISPIAWSHYYLLLLLPYAGYVGGQLMIPKNWQWSLAMLLSVVLVSSPPMQSISSTNPTIIFLMRCFGVSHYFWGAILLLGILLAAQWKIVRSDLYQTIE